MRLIFALNQREIINIKVLNSNSELRGQIAIQSSSATFWSRQDDFYLEWFLFVADWNFNNLPERIFRLGQARRSHSSRSLGYARACAMCAIKIHL